MKFVEPGQNRRRFARATIRFRVLLSALILPIASPCIGHAADDVCARVQIEIVQELTLERVAFDARMKITNGLAVDLTNIRVDVSIENENEGDKSSLFFVKVSELDNIQAVDGTGIAGAGNQCEIHWLIVPSPGAGGETPDGVKYYVGAALSYTAGGNDEYVEVEPDTITVKPQPLLELDYFLPRDVFGDDPDTVETEPPIPYDLGVRVKNVGFGEALHVAIDSGQPKIVDNEAGLLIAFRIIGSHVNGEAFSPSLKVDFGDIEPGSCAVARWEMTSTLNGRFVEFDASFTHSDDLGGQLTSLIDQVNAHFLVHCVLVDIAGRDGIRDFLGETDDGLMVWESDNLEFETHDFSHQSSLARVNDNEYELATQPGIDFLFVKKTAPNQGVVPVQAVYREDGKEIRPENYWIQKTQDGNGGQNVYFCLFDTASRESYTIRYDYDGVGDTTPPVSRLVVSEPSFGTDPIFVNENTELLFLAEDPETGVKTMEFKIDDGDYEPVVNPFTFGQRPLGEGPHAICYYAVNTVGLEETPQSANFYLDNSSPENLAIGATPSSFTPGAPAEVPVARSTTISFSFDDAVDEAEAIVEVARGSGGYFDELPLVRTMTRSVAPGPGASVVWDGTDDGGLVVAAGVYSIRLSVDDGLGHKTLGAPITVQVVAYLDEESLSPSDGDQQYPDIFEQTVAWQDNRDGHWDIYMKTADDPAEQLTYDPGDQQRPAVGADYIAWQDDRSGDWDIYYYDRSGQTVSSLDLDSDQLYPDIDGNWAVFQDNRSGNWEIYACDLSAQPPSPIRLTDGNERDQVRPSISGGRVAWEDYRMGKPEIYLMENLPSGETTRITFQENSYQTHPKIEVNTIIWVDSRHEQNDIYSYDIDTKETRRLTYELVDETQPAMQGDRMAFVRMSEEGNPDISWSRPGAGISEPLIVDPARQEAPALYGNVLVWQDDRIGRWQIYRTTVDRPDLILAVAPGLNLLAAPAEIVRDAETDTAFELLAAWRARGYEATRILQYDMESGAYLEANWDDDAAPPAPAGTDFALEAWQTLVVYADQAFLIPVDSLSPEPALELAAGLNPFGWAGIPSGYKASDLIRSIGQDNVLSVRAYDTDAGMFRTLAVEEIDDGGETAYVIRGMDYALEKGSGCLVELARPTPSWRP